MVPQEVFYNGLVLRWRARGRPAAVAVGVTAWQGCHAVCYSVCIAGRLLPLGGEQQEVESLGVRVALSGVSRHGAVLITKRGTPMARSHGRAVSIRIAAMRRAVSVKWRTSSGCMLRPRTLCSR